jgi:ribonuclease-3
MNLPIKFDWDKKRDEILLKTKNDSREIKKYVLNEKNTKITKKYIEEIFRNYGLNYEVYDITIFMIAMTHPTYINQDFFELKNLKSILMGINFLKGEDLHPITTEQMDMVVQLGDSSYERLELVGDSILRQIISDYLFIRFCDMNEGDITKLRSQIENGSSLAEMARRIGLPKYMLISRNLEAIGIRDKNSKYQCDIFESFIAAIYYDSMKIKYYEIGYKNDLIKKSRGNSFDLCFQFVTSLIEDEIDLSLLLETETNHKDELLKYYHKLSWGDPKYNTMEVIVDNNEMGKKYFKMYVRNNDGNIIGTGVGSSKQKGEKIAAKKALQYLKVNLDDNDDIIINYDSND